MYIPVSISPKSWTETILAEEEPVLFCSSVLPVLSRLEEIPKQRISRYYEGLEKHFQRWCLKTAAPLAKRRRQEARSRSRPFEPWTAELSFESEEADGILTISHQYRRKTMESIHYSAHVMNRWDIHTGFLVGEG